VAAVRSLIARQAAPFAGGFFIASLHPPHVGEGDNVGLAVHATVIARGAFHAKFGVQLPIRNWDSAAALLATNCAEWNFCGRRFLSKAEYRRNVEWQAHFHLHKKEQECSGQIPSSWFIALS
jgi:hypothetical protein